MYQGRSWDHKKVAIKALEREGKDTSLLYLHKEPEEWSRVKRTVDRYVDNFISGLPDQFNYEFYIKGGGNFRHDIATILGYKGHRDEEPYHRKGISDYMVSEFNAKKVYNVEVDDAMGVLATEDTILVHIDKDIDQVPGLHYNPDKDIEYEISKVEGLRNVYKQLIIGDATDAILGLFGVGAKSTHVKKLDLMLDEEEMYSHVHKLYTQRFGTYADTFMLENMQLVWLMRGGEDRIAYWMHQLIPDGLDFYENPYNTMEVA